MLACQGHVSDEGLEVVEELLVVVERPDERPHARLVLRRSASSQLVVRLPSRSAFSDRARAGGGTIGQAPTSVCHTRYSSFGSSIPRVSSRQRRTRSPQRSGMPASAPMRARTSPARFVSCVCDARSCSGWRAKRSSAAAWNSSGPDREATRIAADLVQRREPEVAVEGGVLDALRHHGPGRLLPADDELVELRRPLALEQHDPSQLVVQHAGDSRSASSTRPGRGLDVRAVDVHRRGCLLEPRVVVERAQPCELRARTSCARPRASPRVRSPRTCDARRSARRTAP